MAEFIYFDEVSEAITPEEWRIVFDYLREREKERTDMQKTMSNEPARIKMAEIKDLNEITPGTIITDHPLGEMPIISIYTRKQAIEDGELVDVSDFANNKTGYFICNVCVTRAVWTMIEAIPKSRGWQDVNGRLQDVLWMGRCGLKGLKATVVKVLDWPKGGQIQDVIFRLSLDRNENGRLKTKCDLRAKVHGGDRGEACITISLPDED